MHSRALPGAHIPLPSHCTVFSPFSIPPLLPRGAAMLQAPHSSAALRSSVELLTALCSFSQLCGSVFSSAPGDRRQRQSSTVLPPRATDSDCTDGAAAAARRGSGGDGGGGGGSARYSKVTTARRIQVNPVLLLSAPSHRHITVTLPTHYRHLVTRT